MIQLQNVSKLYQQSKAVDDISFEVKEGETVVLLGTSGCGKTTTLRMINRLTEPTSGTVSVAEKNIQLLKPEALRRGIGYVLQHTGLFPHYTIEENISMVPKLLQWPVQKMQQRTTSLMEKFKLDPSKYASLYPHQLSGGQQQRVGLARALAADPPILLMDEPFGALDPITRTAIRKDFKELDEFKRKTIVLVTHDVQEAFELANRICLMNAGKIVQAGTPMELLFKPASPFVTSFLHEQQFLLELQTITINNVWDYLEPKPAAATTHVSAETSLWDTLQFIMEEGETFSSTQSGTTKVLTSTSLMSAFQHYKSSIE